MKQIKIFFLLVFLLPFSFSVQAAENGDPLWAKSTTTSSNVSFFNGVTIDSNGNRYGVGHISGTDTFDFGNNITVSGSCSGINLVVVKYDVNGNTVWAKSTVSGVDPSKLNGVAADSDGNIYVAGAIFGNNTYDLGDGVTVSGTATSGSSPDIFVAKYDTNGNALWARSTVSGASSSLYGIAVDNNGDVYVAGSLHSSSAYGFGGGVTATGSNAFDNIVLIKYDASGNAKWAKTVSGSTNSSYLYGVALDSCDDPHVGGAVAGTITYNLGDGISVTPAGTSYNTFVAKYNSTGNAQWATSTTSSPDGSSLQAIALDGSGNIFAAGFLDSSGTYGFGNGVNVTASYNGYNALLLKYNSAGYAEWARNPTIAPDASKFFGVSSDYQGNAYVAGYIGGTGQYSFGNNVTAEGVSSNNNLLLVNYDNNGETILAKSVVSGSASTELCALFVNNTSPGDIYAGGYVEGNGVYNLENNITVSGSQTGNNAVIIRYHGDYTISDSSSYPSSSSNSSSSSSSNPAVVSSASSMKHGLPKLFAIGGGAILLLF